MDKIRHLDLLARTLAEASSDAKSENTTSKPSLQEDSKGFREDLITQVTLLLNIADEVEDSNIRLGLQGICLDLLVTIEENADVLPSKEQTAPAERKGNSVVNIATFQKKPFLAH